MTAFEQTEPVFDRVVTLVLYRFCDANERLRTHYEPWPISYGDFLAAEAERLAHKRARVLRYDEWLDELEPAERERSCRNSGRRRPDAAHIGLVIEVRECGWCGLNHRTIECSAWRPNKARGHGQLGSDSEKGDEV